MTAALRPTAPIAAEVILPADPGLALALAQDLLEHPRMANHHHGLWGYSGRARDSGRELTIQATGIGGPSAVAVLADLVELGAERLIRVGPCEARSAAVAPGELVVAAEAIAEDGASRALGAPETVAADPRLTAALLAAGPISRAVVLRGIDLPGAVAPRGGGNDAAAPVGDRETAALLALGRRAGVAVAAALVVAESTPGAATPGADDALARALLSLASVAARAFGDDPGPRAAQVD